MGFDTSFGQYLGCMEDHIAIDRIYYLERVEELARHLPNPVSYLK
jgi:hypothetical protein